MSNLDTIKQATMDIVSKMINDPEIEVVEEDGAFHITIKTEDEAPTVIGRHGETIRALQKILEVMMFKQLEEKVALLINVNDYREKQRERLEYIASEAAKKVQERQSAMYLRGFSSYERRIMHEYIANEYTDLKSYSIGEGRDRRLVVDLASDGESEESPAESFIDNNEDEE